ncbi:hypothetical protein HF086_006895 [Spodoptera exigua]|uniref:Uncharacterized protein n=1 Tax=Spodoptera exigua TaxID=7107 RepID=A0A922MIT7_SPOEX|nr:hypothetical protein HF086_006895 [Spodoptera exigua]
MEWLWGRHWRQWWLTSTCSGLRVKPWHPPRYDRDIGGGKTSKDEMPFAVGWNEPVSGRYRHDIIMFRAFLIHKGDVKKINRRIFKSKYYLVTD